MKLMIIYYALYFKRKSIYLHKKLAFFIKIGIIRRPCKCTDSHRALFYRDHTRRGGDWD